MSSIPSVSINVTSKCTQISDVLMLNIFWTFKTSYQCYISIQFHSTVEIWINICLCCSFALHLNNVYFHSRVSRCQRSKILNYATNWVIFIQISVHCRLHWEINQWFKLWHSQNFITIFIQNLWFYLSTFKIYCLRAFIISHTAQNNPCNSF